MTNRFLRFVALVLVPCLVADPRLSHACRSVGLRKGTPLMTSVPFATEAIVPSSFTSWRIDPHCLHITQEAAHQARISLSRQDFLTCLAGVFAFATPGGVVEAVSTNVSPEMQRKKQILSEFVGSTEFTNYFDQGEDLPFLQKAKETDEKLDAKGTFESAMQELVQFSERLDDNEVKREAMQLLRSAIKRICPSFEAYLFFERDPKDNKIWRYRIIVIDVVDSKAYLTPSGKNIFFYRGDRLDHTNYLKDVEAASFGGESILLFTKNLDKAFKFTKNLIGSSTQRGIPDKIRQALRLLAEKMGSDGVIMADIFRSTEAHEYAHLQLQAGPTRYAFNASPFSSDVENYHFGILDWERLSEREQIDIEHEVAAYLSQIATVPESTPWVVSLELFLLADKVSKGDRAAQFVLNRLADRPRNEWVPLGDNPGITQLVLELLDHPRLLDHARELLERGYPGLELLLPSQFQPAPQSSEDVTASPSISHPQGMPGNQSIGSANDFLKVPLIWLIVGGAGAALLSLFLGRRRLKAAS